MSAESLLPDDVRARAQSALATSPIPELRTVEVQQQEGSLLLAGTVSSFYHKQLAQEVIRTVCREIDLINSVDVR